MDRNYILVKKIAMFPVYVFLVSFWSCSKPLLVQEDMIGEWKSDMDEVLILYADSTFVAKNILIDNYTVNHIFCDSSETKINGEGTWKVYGDRYGNRLRLSYSNFTIKKGIIEKGYHYSLSVIGSGLLENRLPWKIISWFGDPDSGDYNVFQKVERKD